MYTFLRWAYLNAVLFGWCHLSFADGNGTVEYSLAADNAMYDSYVLETSYLDGSLHQLFGDSGDPCLGTCVDNTVFFLGADNYKSIGERLTNINGGTGALTSSFGGVVGFNTGFGLGESDLRGQIGASYGVYDLRGRLRIVPQATDVEEQGFFTAGVYKRGNMHEHCDPLSYGVVVDAFTTSNWGINANSIDLGQLRGVVGYALSERFEIGAFGTANLWHDRAAVTVAGAPNVQREVRAANQLNGYLRGNTNFGGSLTAYAGAFDRADIQAWQFGLTGDAPLSSWFSLYGNFNYAVPSATAGPTGSGEEQFNMQFGLVYYLGGKAVSPSVTGQQGLPLLDVANNGSFLITD